MVEDCQQQPEEEDEDHEVSRHTDTNAGRMRSHDTLIQTQGEYLVHLRVAWLQESFKRLKEKPCVASCRPLLPSLLLLFHSSSCHSRGKLW